MDRQTAITLLKHHRAELAELGVLSASLIGSTARDEATATSDVDVAVKLAPGPRGFAHLERLDQLKQRLAAMLGCGVDVIEEPAPSPRVQRNIEQDRVLAF
jgi:predicted nucleotidyltransferase